mgnify:CR=1 FL=1
MPLLEIRNLKKIYRTPEGETLTVLDVPEFALEERQQLVLRGASGTGKTTVAEALGHALLNRRPIDIFATWFIA